MTQVSKTQRGDRVGTPYGPGTFVTYHVGGGHRGRYHRAAIVELDREGGREATIPARQLTTTMEAPMPQTITRDDVRNQVLATLQGEEHNGIDADGIVAYIVDEFGLVDVGTIERDVYWDIVRANDYLGFGQD